MQTTDRDYALEAMRGIAAIVVLLGHCILGFYPEYSGFFTEDLALRRLWIYGLSNGTAAVTFFFVLSGFVLVKSFFVSYSPTDLANSAIRRWPRLAGPVAASVLFSYGLYALGLYCFNEAAQITHSPWLNHHLTADGATLGGAIWMGLTTFFTEDRGLNTSLWTMTYEINGSYLVYALAACFLIMKRIKPLAVAITIYGFLHFFHSPNVNYAAFPAGVLLAFALSFVRTRPLHGGVVATLATVSIFMFGQTAGYARPFNWLDFDNPLKTYIAASVLLIASIEMYSGKVAVFNRPWARILGRASFPIYLVQIPVLCSLGSAALIATRQPSVALVATILGTFAAAAPIYYFDIWWTSVLRRRLSLDAIKRFSRYPWRAGIEDRC